MHKPGSLCHCVMWNLISGLILHQNREGQDAQATLIHLNWHIAHTLWFFGHPQNHRATSTDIASRRSTKSSEHGVKVSRSAQEEEGLVKCLH